MGYTEKLENGRWKGTYRTPQGRERSRTFDRKGDADRYWTGAETDKTRGDWVDPRHGRITVKEYSARWLPILVHIKPKTRSGYESLLRTQVLPVFGDTALTHVEQAAVANWVAAMTAAGLSASRIRQAYRVLSGLMKTAVQAGYIAKSPCVGVKLPRMLRRDGILLTPEMIDALAEAIAQPRPKKHASAPEPRTLEQQAALVYLLAYGGLRWGEAAALRRKRCDLLRGRVEVAEAVSDVNGHLHYGPTKTYETRWVRLPKFLVEMLTHHLEGVPNDPQALVFTGEKGGPLRYPVLRRSFWDAAVMAVGLPPEFTPHHLRHTCASLLIASGADPVAVQRHLGHKDVATTLNIYAGLFPNRLEEIAVALDAIYRESRSELSRPARGLLGRATAG